MNSMQEFEEKEAVRMVTVRYSRAVDTRDWPLFRSLYTDPVWIDIGPLARVGVWSADDWARNIEEGVSGFDATHHQNGNHDIVVNGDEARCVHYVLAEHCIYSDPSAQLTGYDDTLTFGGWYTSQYRKTAEGWKIARLVLTRSFIRGNIGLFEVARQRWLARR